jgi:hypothetical protein
MRSSKCKGNGCRADTSMGTMLADLITYRRRTGLVATRPPEGRHSRLMRYGISSDAIKLRRRLGTTSLGIPPCTTQAHTRISNRIQAESVSEQVYHLLSHKHAFVAVGRTVSSGRSLVCERTRDLTPVVRNSVGSRQKGRGQFWCRDAEGGRAEAAMPDGPGECL